MSSKEGESMIGHIHKNIRIYSYTVQNTELTNHA